MQGTGRMAGLVSLRSPDGFDAKLEIDRTHRGSFESKCDSEFGQLTRCLPHNCQPFSLSLRCTDSEVSLGTDLDCS